MVSSVRIKGKELLCRNTIRFFLVSIVSFLFRYGIVSVNIGAFYLFFESGYRIEYIFVPVIFFVVSLLFVSGIKMGEEFIYFIRADGGNGRFLLLFKFLSPENSLKATLFYIKVNFLKAFWLLYFLLPSLICGGCSFYLYKTSIINDFVSFTLLTGTIVLFCLSLVVWRTAILRYKAATYYFCLDDNRLVNKAIKKSVQFTDGSLSDGVVLEYSLLGWILSCAFVVPIVYVLPYIRLCKAIYTIEAVQGAKPCKTRYAVNIISVM